MSICRRPECHVKGCDRGVSSRWVYVKGWRDLCLPCWLKARRGKRLVFDAFDPARHRSCSENNRLSAPSKEVPTWQT